VIEGKSLAAIAREEGVSRQAIWKHASSGSVNDAWLANLLARVSHRGPSAIKATIPGRALKNIKIKKTIKLCRGISPLGLPVGRDVLFVAA
jgi:hypothetical protein